MSKTLTEEKNKIFHLEGKYSSKTDTAKENTITNKEIKPKFMKINKSIFSVSRNVISEKEKIKENKKEEKKENLKEKLFNTTKNELNKEEKIETIKKSNNPIENKKAEEIKEEKKPEENQKDNAIKNKEEKDKNNDETNININNSNTIEKQSINNNFNLIGNKESISTLNTNSSNINPINNNDKNTSINNIMNSGTNNNLNIINSINYDINNNFFNDLEFKENNINRNNNVEKNNILNNNNEFKRGNSLQPKYNRNTFLNRKHHLLENAIIKKQFQEPKRKAILKDEKYPYSPYSNYKSNEYDNNSEFQRIINLDETDSENYFNEKYIEDDIENDKDSQDYEDEDINERDSDEEFCINNNYKNKKISSDYKLNSRKKGPESILYYKLYDLVKQYSFNKIIESISNYYNGKIDMKSNQNEDNELNQKLNDLLDNIEKDSLNPILIKILTNNFEENKKKLMELISLSKRKSSSVEIKEISRVRSLRRGKSLSVIKNDLRFKRRHTKKQSPPFYYGKHFYKINNKIYTYVPKAKASSGNKYTLYCLNRAKDECMAKIIVNQNNNEISYIENHICNPKMTLEEFYRKYPYISKEPDWTHIQFAVENEKSFILSRV